MRSRPASADDAMPQDAGLTLLEVLIGLAIMATIAMVVSTSIRLPDDAPVSAKAAFLSFFGRAQTEVRRKGEPELLLLDAGQATAGAETVQWDPHTFAVEATPAVAGTIRALLFPDGTVSSPQLTLRDGGKVVPLRLVYLPS